MGGALEVLGTSLKTVLDETHFAVNLHSFSFHVNPQVNLSFPQVSHLTVSHVEQLQNSSLL